MSFNPFSAEFIEHFLLNRFLDCVIDDSDASVMYIGFAKTGSAITDSEWCIMRTKKTGGLTYERWADGEILFNKKFSLRATYDYIES